MYKPFIRRNLIPVDVDSWEDEASLKLRILKIDSWLEEQKNYKDRHMMYMVMYDIENNKIRTQVAKYLIKKGCLRIQKSVYLSKSNRVTYEGICQVLKEINVMYDNRDSILILPVPEDKFHHMKMIGHNVEFEVVTKPKNVLFF